MSGHHQVPASNICTGHIKWLRKVGILRVNMHLMPLHLQCTVKCVQKNTTPNPSLLGLCLSFFELLELTEKTNNLDWKDKEHGLSTTCNSVTFR